MSKTIRTPHLTFRTRRLRPVFSEHISHDDQVSQVVAQPLFDSGARSAAITERADYSSHPVQEVQPYHSLRILLQGSMIVETGDARHVMEPGELAICSAGTPMRCFQDGSPAWWMYFILKDGPSWEPLKRHGCSVRPCGSTPLLFLLLRDILDARALLEPVAVTRARGNARSIVRLLRAEMNRGGSRLPEHGTTVRELAEAIAAEPGKNWTRQLMADELHVSVSRLKRLFRDELGVSPGTLVIRQRMHRAVELLVNSNRKIGDIANELGYESLHSFTRLFTKYVGMAPGRYRDRFGGSGRDRL
jgi:AraC-like DNA-binding protein